MNTPLQSSPQLSPWSAEAVVCLGDLAQAEGTSAFPNPLLRRVGRIGASWNCAGLGRFAFT